MDCFPPRRTSDLGRTGRHRPVLACALALAVPAPAGAADSTPFEINSAATGKCLEVSDWRRDAGAPVRQWTCTGGANQQWAANSNGFLVNRNSGLC
ncbi:RICIN domain-containing protein, partial [Streptomyces sp. BE303]|uniref:RICIN domain-containing protein n=1 Tax=Streptomyces sp. BE303 TaxID=3002528 RepID=UPI002E7A77D3